jgi:predicted dehydrogenase
MIMTLRWGILGSGDVAETKGGPALQQAADSTVVASMRRDPKAAQDFASRHNIPRFYTSVDALLADSEIDAVYVASPVYAHREHTLMAARAGKHVLVEKPMGLTSADCEEMIAVCKRAGVQLGVAYYRRFYPVIMRIRDLLGERAIGQVIQAQCLFGSFFTGKDQFANSQWRSIPELAGGGVLMDIGSHRVDLLLHLLGPLAEVQALIKTQTQKIDVEDSASLLLAFENGVQAMLGFYWNMRERVDRFEINGTEGRIVVSHLEEGRLELYRYGHDVEYQTLEPPKPTHRGLVHDFVQSVAIGRAPAVSGEDGLATNRVLEAAYRASLERRAIPVHTVIR